MSGRDDDNEVGYPDGLSGPDLDGLDGALDTPVDLAAVQADDAFLDMLGRSDAIPGDADADLARVLVAWRREVDTESIGELVDVDSATARIAAAHTPRRRRHPTLGPVAAAAAVLVIAFSAIGLLAKSAQPGDQLWGLTEVLYADYARSVKAAASVKGDLEEARTALEQGRTSEARESLQRAQQQLQVIAEAEGHKELAAEHHELEVKLHEMPVDPADPGTATPDDPRTSTTWLPLRPAAPSSEEPSTTQAPVEPTTPPDPSSEPTEPTTTPSSSPMTLDSAPGPSETSPRTVPSEGGTSSGTALPTN